MLDLGAIFKGFGFLLLRQKSVSLNLICVNVHKVGRGVASIPFLSSFVVHQHAHSE